MGVRSGVLGDPPAGKTRPRMGHRHAQIAAARAALVSRRRRDAPGASEIAALLPRTALNQLAGHTPKSDISMPQSTGAERDVADPPRPHSHFVLSGLKSGRIWET